VDPRLKQRLVGAAVLLALAVIFLPMLLDGGGRDAEVSLREAIPPEPEFPRPETVAPLSLDAPPEAEPAETRPLPRTEARSVPAPEALPERPVSPPLAAQPVPEPTPEPTPQAATRPAPESAPASPPRDAAGSPGGFTVQVGSFGEEANARAERDRLRGAGFTAFVEPASAQGRAIYRVKVGPVSERTEAERLRDRIREQMQLQGIIVAHP
jgi:DedD protein